MKNKSRLFLAASMVAVSAAALGQPLRQRDSAVDRLGIRFAPVASTTAARPTSDSLTATGPTVLLDPIEVSGAKIKLTEREVLTEKGRMEYAQKHFLSPMYRKAVGPLAQLATYYYDWPSILGGWHPNEAEAMLLYWQDESVRMTREVDDLAALGGIVDSKEARELKRISLEFRSSRQQGIFIGK